MITIVILRLYRVMTDLLSTDVLYILLRFFATFILWFHIHLTTCCISYSGRMYIDPRSVQRGLEIFVSELKKYKHLQKATSSV